MAVDQMKAEALLCLLLYQRKRMTGCKVGC